MELKEALAKLESLGNESVRAHNRKWGVDDNQFGVKMGDIRAIAKAIKIDHDLAAQLWQTGNMDAMQLSMLIVKPKQLSAQQLDDMAHQVKYAHVADWFNNYIVKEHPDKDQFRERWMNDSNPWAARSGWSLTSGRVARQPEGIDISALLDRLEAEMPTAPEPVQWTMNSALANIGIKHPQYRERALQIGEKLGIYRDYPVSKGCTSPFAPIWINEMVKREG